MTSRSAKDPARSQTLFGLPKAGYMKLARVVLEICGYGGIVSAADKIRDVYKAFSKGVDEELPLSQQLWLSTFSVALGHCLNDQRINVDLDRKELQSAISSFLEKAFDPSFEFGEECLIDPVTYKAYEPIRDNICSFLIKIDPELVIDDEKAWQFKLDDCLKKALIQVWSDNVSLYQPVVDGFSGPIAESVRRQQCWIKHYSWIRSMHEKIPVFSPEERTSRVRLCDVFIRLRCCWHEYIEEELDEYSNSEAGASTRVICHVSDLEEEVLNWIAKRKFWRDPIRLIAGSPGSGKSSFSRALATRLIAMNNCQVLFFELQHLTLRDDLEGVIEHYLTRIRRVFHESPLTWPLTPQKPTIMIFDGLDELVRSESRAAEMAKSFVYNLKRLINAIQSRENLICAIVLGRSTAIEEARRDAEMEHSCVLHLLPIGKPGKWHLGTWKNWIGDHHEIVDPAGLLYKDQRIEYWKVWHEVTGMTPAPFPHALNSRDFEDLTSEPLLYHLLIVSGYLNGEKKLNGSLDRNEVYRAIFEKIFERDKHKGNWVLAKLTSDDFFTLMECLGLASWTSSGRTGNDQDFQKLRTIYCSRALESKFKKLPNTDLKSAVLMFYTRRDQETDTGYEFVHRSFGEYLIARGIISLAERIASDSHATDEDLGLLWLKICGNKPVSDEIYQFMLREAKYRPLEKAALIKDRLTNIIDWALIHGLPAHKLDDGKCYSDIEIRQSVAEGNLLAAMNSMAVHIGETDPEKAFVDISWASSKSAKRMANRFDMINTPTGSFAFYFDYFSFSQVRITNVSDDPESKVSYSIGPENFLIHPGQVQDFAYKKLKYARLKHAYLAFCDFFKANLNIADLRYADLRRTDLRTADLIETDLNHATLAGAYMCQADLRQASLAHADLRGADLNKANLSGAHLYKTDFRYADLSNADLRGAYIVSADFTGAVIDGAIFNNAILEDTVGLSIVVLLGQE